MLKSQQKKKENTQNIGIGPGAGSLTGIWRRQLASGPAAGIWPIIGRWHLEGKNVSFKRPINYFNFWCHAPIGYLIFGRLGKDPLYDRPLAQKGTKQCAKEGMRSAGGPLYDQILAQNHIKQCTKETNH